jgi:hypothetical protein
MHDKKLFIGIVVAVCVVLVGVSFRCPQSSAADAIRLGDCRSQHVWVYLCGLTSDFNDTKEKQHRALLERLGNKLNICFIALKPTHRCAQYHDMLCWPHESDEEVLNTYREIRERVGKTRVQGYIGFSNGGFFLNRLVQMVEVGIPIISIGSAGYLSHAPYDNTLYLLVGRQDPLYQTHAIPFYEQLAGSRIVTYFMPYNSGHELEMGSLEAALRSISALSNEFASI